MGSKDSGAGPGYTPPMRTAIAIVISGMLGACAAVPVRVTDNPVPPDFSLEVKDYSPDGGALFIVEPDRWFRAAAGAEPIEQVYPPATRLLTPDEMTLLWELVRAAETDPPESPASAWLAVETNADGKRRRATLSPDADPDARQLIAELRRLAWIRPDRE